MKHPTSEAWMAYLYNDYPPNAEAEKAEAEKHLANCAECRQQVREWRTTLGLLDQDRVSAPAEPIAVAALVPAGRSIFTRARSVWPWALAAGVMMSASFISGRALGPSRAEFQQELAKARVEMAREIALEIRTEQQRDLAELASAALKATAAGQRELAMNLLAGINETRQKDRREIFAALEQLEQMDQRLRDGVQSLAEKTGGAFEETDTRLNALASALPMPEGFQTP